MWIQYQNLYLSIVDDWIIKLKRIMVVNCHTTLSWPNYDEMHHTSYVLRKYTDSDLRCMPQRASRSCEVPIWTWRRCRQLCHHKRWRDSNSCSMWQRTSGSCQLLCDLGVNVKANNICGRTSLLLVSARGRMEVVQQLLSCGADVNTNDR